MLKKIGANIRKIRKENNLAQDGLGILAKMSQHTISEIELGHRNMTLLTLEKLVK